MDCSQPASPVHGISPARILELVTIASPGDLPDPGVEPRFSTLQVDSLSLSHPGFPVYTCVYIHTYTH